MSPKPLSELPPGFFKKSVTREYDDEVLNWVHSYPVNYDPHVDIVRNGWKGGIDLPKPLRHALAEVHYEVISEFAEILGFGPHVTKRDVVWDSQMWFHHYTEGKQFKWHCHAGSFALIHYMELPKGATTEFWINNEIVVPDVEEGDVLIFPAYTIHRSPPNPSSDTKTIWARNFNLAMPSETKKYIEVLTS